MPLDGTAAGFSEGLQRLEELDGFAFLPIKPVEHDHSAHHAHMGGCVAGACTDYRQSLAAVWGKRIADSFYGIRVAGTAIARGQPLTAVENFIGPLLKTWEDLREKHPEYINRVELASNSYGPIQHIISVALSNGDKPKLLHAGHWDCAAMKLLFQIGKREITERVLTQPTLGIREHIEKVLLQDRNEGKKADKVRQLILKNMKEHEGEEKVTAICDAIFEEVLPGEVEASQKREELERFLRQEIICSSERKGKKADKIWNFIKEVILDGKEDSEKVLLIGKKRDFKDAQIGQFLFHSTELIEAFKRVAVLRDVIEQQRSDLEARGIVITDEMIDQAAINVLTCAVEINNINRYFDHPDVRRLREEDEKEASAISVIDHPYTHKKMVFVPEKGMFVDMEAAVKAGLLADLRYPDMWTRLKDIWSRLNGKAPERDWERYLENKSNINSRGEGTFSVVISEKINGEAFLDKTFAMVTKNLGIDLGKVDVHALPQRDHTSYRWLPVASSCVPA